ncbi:MAG: bifunctional phosphoribosyl-AMP cyclohydrolase/phosphoribosyl-ATP diphosphatase HisIE, partial [Candidatus Margulisiibacteriota bacterium]
ATYYSRSRKSIWKKGETSGNRQKIVDVRVDCDEDSLLYLVEEEGPACHTGETTCFHRSLLESEAAKPQAYEVLTSLYDKVLSRREHKTEGSYVTSLFGKGSDKIIQKVGEEAVETVIALKNRSRDEIIYESADLLFHLIVALVDQDILLTDIENALVQRYK